MSREKDYWKVPLTPELKDDADLIKELNKKEEEECQKKTTDRSSFSKIVGAIAAIGLLIFILGPLVQVYNLASRGFFAETLDMEGNPRVENLKKAVVFVRAQGKQGTGFNIDEGGLIVTNHHIIERAHTIGICFSEEHKFTGIKYLAFPEVDLAVIDIKGDNLPTVKLEREQFLTEGEEVIVIGNPLGFSNVVKKGRVIGRTRLKGWKEPVLLIKGSFYRGSSGSPAFNSRGKVAAIIFATLENGKSSGDRETIGLAVPVEDLLKRLEVSL